MNKISVVLAIWTDIHYPGGSDTVVHNLAGFILAMLMNPEVQTKAHSELKKVLGPGDLPNFDDEPALPFITAIVREVVRHNPVTPFGKCSVFQIQVH